MNAPFVPLKRAFPVSNGYGPADGAKSLTMVFPWDTVAAHYVDMYQETSDNVIRNVQSVYVDNSLNTAEFVMLVEITRQRLVVPAQASGIWPVISVPEIKFLASSTLAADQLTTIILLNVPMPLTQWGPVTISGNTINVAAIATGNWTDRSGTLTLGGTSQQIAAANAGRLGFIIQNPSSEIESLYVNCDAAASVADSIEIPPGTSYNFGPQFSLGAVNVIAATTGHAWVAKELL